MALTSNNKLEQAQSQKISQPLVEKVAIIGAGPGGLACAIALLKQGIDVQVYEKARELRPAGAGLGLTPNGLNFLEAIEPGVVETLKNSGCCVRSSVLKNSAGETIRTNPSLMAEKYGQPLVTVWWWRLQQILASKLPPECIRLNHHCVGFEQDDSGVEVHFEQGKTARADLLIGADGLNSVIREALTKDKTLRYLGSMGWRSVVKCNQQLLNPNELVFIKGNQQFMFLLNIGERYISWVTRKLSPDYSVSHSPTEVKSRVLGELADWAEPIRALVEATPAEQIVEGQICDRPPLRRWSEGRVTLLGDAAHPMAPAMAQGANTTFEDAYELAVSLEHSSSVEAALTNYQQRRQERTQVIQARSALAEMAYYQTDREQSIRQTVEQAQVANNEEFQEWVYSYKPHFS